MSQDNGNRRRLVGAFVALSLFIAWILVDIYVFPMIGISTNYPLYELVAYGSWIVVSIIVFLILSLAGWFPMRSPNISSNPDNSEF